MRRLSAIAICFALATPASGADSGPQMNGPWKETPWPFLRDAWPSGRAFHCDAAQCGADVELYARMKVGFCDCSKGVSDDEEIDRVGDVDLVEPNFTPREPGSPAVVSGISGRTRAYVTSEKTPRRIVVYAGGRNCNAFVAMAVSQEELGAGPLDAARRMLEDPAFLRWLTLQEGG